MADTDKNSSLESLLDTRTLLIASLVLYMYGILSTTKEKLKDDLPLLFSINGIGSLFVVRGASIKPLGLN